jgi:hypothetical protein
MIHLNVHFWNDRAYFVVMGRTEVGVMWDTGQAFASRLDAAELAARLAQAAAIGNPPIAHPSMLNSIT